LKRNEALELYGKSFVGMRISQRHYYLRIETFLGSVHRYNSLPLDSITRTLALVLERCFA
jgi:hypothetical protein